MTNILDHFPFETPRDNQIIALNWLAESDKKYLLLEAPVGSGKSPIGICYSSHLTNGKGNSYILTPQKILQDQYTASFDSTQIGSLYGKSNYSCQSRHTTCDIGSLVKPACSYCPFRSALQKAKLANNTVFNYSLAMSLFSYTDIFDNDKRALMVLDECHTLEQILTEFNLIEIYQVRAKKYGIKDWPDLYNMNISNAYDWTKRIYLPAAKSHLEKLQAKVEVMLEYGDSIGNKEMRIIQECDKLESQVDSITEFLLLEKKTYQDKYVFVHDKKTFKFKPITGKKNFHDILEPYANRFLFMSSTILDKDGFCRDLGLPPDETDFLSLGSDFPIEKRPVYYIPQMKMNQGWDKPARLKQFGKMVDGIQSLLDIHKDESGIIHTANFKLATKLVDELTNYGSHEVLEHSPESGNDRNKVIKAFSNISTPTLLISPSITEGLDLVDDQARFAIFAKVPFPYLGDQWIRKRLEMSQEWYQRRTLINVIQGGGRIVRSKEDHGIVYILDESWGYLYQTTYNKIPKWWLKAYTQV